MWEDLEQLRKDLWLELGAAALQGTLYPFGLRARPVKAVGSGRARPVILIPGTTGNRASLLPLEGYLRSMGFDRIFPFHPGSARGFEAAAAALRRFVEEVRRECRLRNETVDLVAHCLGGLVARGFLQTEGAARWVDQCVTLCTPHLGTQSTFWIQATVGPALRAGSDYLRVLNDPARQPRGVRFFSIWGEQDLLVVPRENAIYPAGGSAGLRGVGHNGALVSLAAFALVRDRLLAGQLLQPTRLARAVRLGDRVLAAGRAVVTGIEKALPRGRRAGRRRGVRPR